MVIRIERRTLEGIHAHAESTYPEECCGLLIATPKSKNVVDSVKMRNAFQGPKSDRYHIDPLELFKADREAARKGLAIAGVYHSHPDYPATLSKFDIDHSFPWYSYVVVSVPKGAAGDTRSWIPNQERDGVTEEEIEVYQSAQQRGGTRQ
ncbi:MAG TPA: M67 family metallopeptidase [Nitrososphaerales archaeon]|nr:M67 family metallopeptidase [Nitrososphaerales archaeon]HUK74922.1 M67 family metallopeptidase [Nitrososphaerales archaeon]